VTGRRVLVFSGVLVAVLFTVFFLKTYGAAYYTVDAATMMKGFEEGDGVVINRFHYYFHQYRRGEVVCLRTPDGAPTLRRIVCLPGEVLEIRRGRVMINGAALEEAFGKRDAKLSYGPVYLYPGYVFVLADRGGAKQDSLTWGAVHVRTIIGKPLVVVWPPRRKRLL